MKHTGAHTCIPNLFSHHCRDSAGLALYPADPFAAHILLYLSFKQIFDSDIMFLTLKFCPRKQIGRERELTVMFVLRNTGSLSLGSSVTDWLMKGCFFRAQIILLQSLNPKSGTFGTVQDQKQTSSFTDILFCDEAKKKLLRMVDCFELCEYDFEACTVSKRNHAVTMATSFKTKQRGFVQLGHPAAALLHFILCHTQCFSLCLICRCRNQTVLVLGFPGCTLCLHGKCLQAVICVCPSSSIEWISQECWNGMEEFPRRSDKSVRQT